MTTVAFDGESLAVDSQANTDDGYKFVVAKLQRLRDGSFFAGCGDLQNCLAVAAWLDEGQGPKPVLASSFVGLHVYTDKATVRCVRYETTLIPFEVQAGHAVGAGRDFAVAAMAMGKTSAESVLLACQFNCFTGPPVLCAWPRIGVVAQYTPI
jgi:hypothetical protein